MTHLRCERRRIIRKKKNSFVLGLGQNLLEYSPSLSNGISPVVSLVRVVPPLLASVLPLFLLLAPPLSLSLARAPLNSHSTYDSSSHPSFSSLCRILSFARLLARFHSPTPSRFIRRETFYVVYIKGNVSTGFPLKRISSN